MLAPGTSFYRQRDKDFLPFFSHADKLVFYNNIAGVFNAMNASYERHEWRLFIDSKTSLKAVLLHNGNLLPSIPVGHLVNL